MIDQEKCPAPGQVATAEKAPVGTAVLEVLKLSLPASLSMLNRTVMQFVDGFMIGHLGQAALSAQMIGSLAALVPESFGTGVLTVVNTYVSQNLGAGRLNRCGQYAWAGIFLALLLAAFVAPLLFAAGPLFDLIGHEERNLEAMYFAWMLGSVVITLPTRVFEQFFFGVNRSGVVWMASIIANGFNLLANLTLIFGLFGFPALGLLGSAIGTVAAWGLQLLILAVAFVSGPIHQRYATRDFRSASRGQMLDLVRIGYPAGIQFFSDILPWTVFMAVLVGHFGEAHRAASTVAMRYMPLSFMPAVGIGIAATALVGKYIGRGRPDLASNRAHVALALALGYMGACGLAFLTFRHPLAEVFIRDGGQTVDIAAKVLICAAVFQLFDAMGIVYIGSLRGAGDTFWPMVATAGLSLVFTLLGGWLMVRYLPRLESIGPWIAASGYVVVLGVLMAWRFEAGNWRKIDLLGRQRQTLTG